VIDPDRSGNGNAHGPPAILSGAQIRADMSFVSD
jgi:hypothetical protein